MCIAIQQTAKTEGTVSLDADGIESCKRNLDVSCNEMKSHSIV